MARGVERPSGLPKLTIRWNTLDDHLVGFPESPSFATWRALLSPYYSAAPRSSTGRKSALDRLTTDD